MTTEEQIIAGYQERLQAALEGFERLNGQDTGLQYGPPPDWQPGVAVGVLIDILVARGIMSQEEFVIHTLMRQVEVVEDSLRAAATNLRERTGIIVPLGMSGRPQG